MDEAPVLVLLDFFIRVVVRPEVGHPWSMSTSSVDIALLFTAWTFATDESLIELVVCSAWMLGGGDRRGFLLVGDNGACISLLRLGGFGKLYDGFEGSIKLAIDGDALALAYFGGAFGGVGDLTGALYELWGDRVRDSIVAERMGS